MDECQFRELLVITGQFKDIDAFAGNVLVAAWC